MNVSIGQDDSKLLYDVIVNATATNDMSGSAAGPSYAVPNISIACTPAYREPLLNATTMSLWWADEPYWEASELHVLCPWNRFTARAMFAAAETFGPFYAPVFKCKLHGNVSDYHEDALELLTHE